MDFALSADRRMMQAALAEALARLAPLERVRAFADGETAVEGEVWRGLTEFGLAGLVIGEEHGGLGLSLLDAALTAETLGRHVTPAPFLASAVLAPLALTAAGSAEQRAAWLPRLAAGEATMGIAIGEAVCGARDGAGVAASGGRLEGSSLFVIGPGADAFIVAEGAGGAGGLWLTAGDAPGLTRRPLVTIDRTRTLGELRFAGAPAEPLASGAPGATLTRLRDAAWVMLAADILGAAEAMLEKAVAYAGERRQFGRIIASFQAVKHLCAEMAAELEPCHALVWYAAHAFDAAPEEASLMAAHGKAHLSEVGRFVAKAATEVHGGVGFTDLMGLHYWFKRIGLDRQLLGGPERVRHLAAVMQGFSAA